MTLVPRLQAMQAAMQAHAAGRLREAEAEYRRLLAINPDDVDALHLLGVLACQTGQREAGLELLQAAVRIQPGHVMAWRNLAVGLNQLGRVDEAVVALERVVAMTPTYVDGLIGLGGTLRTVGRSDEAIATYRAALRLAPERAELHQNLAAALIDAGQVAAAVESNETALRLQPDLAQAHLNLAVALLVQGDYARGLVEYEWRWKCAHSVAVRFPDALRWRGEPLNGRRLLLHAEQGLGDTIQFSRYAALAASRGGRVVLEVQPPLRQLLKQTPGVECVISQGEMIPPFDLHCPLLSLPGVMGTRVETIPPPQGLLRADERLTTLFRQLFPSAPGQVRIGVAWAGHPGNPSDRRRSILPASRLAPIFDVAGVDFFSFQKGLGPTDPAALDRNGRQVMADVGPLFRDFSETAAALATMDLMITVDGVMAHLAGAMGKPAWVMLPFSPDWRWLLFRDDSPWHPSVRLFRQQRRGDWLEVIARVADQLRTFVAERRK